MSENPKPLELVKAELPPPAPATLAGVNIEALLNKAIDAKSAVEVLERLCVMRREAKAEAAKEAFDEAMSLFQDECPVIRKDSEVFEKGSSTHVRYRYAPLEAIVSQVKGLLRKHGFSHKEDARVECEWVSDPKSQNKDAKIQAGWVTGECKVTHRAGHSESSTFKVPIAVDAYMTSPQRFASAFTFAKRYAFCAAFGILTGDQDDDANGADGPREPTPPRKPQERPAPPSRPPRTSQGPKPPAKPQSAPTPPQNGGTPEERALLLRELRGLIGKAGFEAHVVRYLQEVASQAGKILLMPNEGLEDLSAGELRGMIKHWDEAVPKIEMWVSEHPEQAPGPNEAEAWRAVIVPIPRKGQRRDDYLANPDTLGTLYDACKTDEKARKRLFGFVGHFEPSKTWVDSQGKSHTRSQDDYDAELDFREGLDAFEAWHDTQTKTKNL